MGNVCNAFRTARLRLSEVAARLSNVLSVSCPMMPQAWQARTPLPPRWGLFPSCQPSTKQTTAPRGRERLKALTILKSPRRGAAAAPVSCPGQPPGVLTLESVLQAAPAPHPNLGKRPGPPQASPSAPLTPEHPTGSPSCSLPGPAPSTAQTHAVHQQNREQVRQARAGRAATAHGEDRP